MVFLELHSPPVISFAGYHSLSVERATKKVMVSMQITALTFKTSDGKLGNGHVAWLRLGWVRV